MALTNALVASLYSMSGQAFAWPAHLSPAATDRPSAGKRKGGSPRNGMRVWLWEAQGRICPTCGGAIANPLVGSDIAHVVGSGPDRKGFTAGNVYMSHPSCNVGAAREAWEAGSNGGAYRGQGTGNVDRNKALSALLSGVGANDISASGTDSNNAGNALILIPSDFARPDVIASEWPGATVGAFIYQDPSFEGVRKV